MNKYLICLASFFMCMAFTNANAQAVLPPNSLEFTGSKTGNYYEAKIKANYGKWEAGVAIVELYGFYFVDCLYGQELSGGDILVCGGSSVAESAEASYHTLPDDEREEEWILKYCDSGQNLNSGSLIYEVCHYKLLS